MSVVRPLVTSIWCGARLALLMVGHPLSGQPVHPDDPTASSDRTKVRIVVVASRARAEDVAVLRRAAARLAATAPRWLPGLGSFTIRIAPTNGVVPTFAVYEDASGPVVRLATDGVSEVRRAMASRKRNRAALEDALVAIGLHELGHVVTRRHELLLGDRGELFADEMVVLLASRTRHQWLVERLIDYLEFSATPEDDAVGGIYLSTAARTRRLRCLASAATTGKGSCLAAWKAVERDLQPLVLPARQRSRR